MEISCGDGTPPESEDEVFYLYYPESPDSASTSIDSSSGYENEVIRLSAPASPTDLESGDDEVIRLSAPASPTDSESGNDVILYLSAPAS